MKIFNWVHRRFSQNNDKDPGQGKTEQSVDCKRAGDGCRAGIGARKSSHSARRMSRSPSPSLFPKEKDITDIPKLLIHSHSALTLTAAAAFQQVEAEKHWLSFGGETTTDEEVRSLYSRGLLAIGTFGLERVDEEEEKEVRNLVERVDSDVTADDVELFHDELDKVFGRKIHHELDPRLGSPDNSESQSLSMLHGNGNSSSVNDLYPLHQFFLNSSKADIPVSSNRRKDQSAPRTSLKDLFSTTNGREDQQDFMKPSDSKGSEYNASAEGAKKSGWSLSSLVKKAVKGKTHSTNLCKVESRCSRLEKGLFNNKIYPEHGAATDPNTAVRVPRPHAKKKSMFTSCILPPKLNEHEDDQDNSIATAHKNCDPELVCSAGLCTGHEHWINTDADYVVLEF